MTVSIGWSPHEKMLGINTDRGKFLTPSVFLHYKVRVTLNSARRRHKKIKLAATKEFLFSGVDTS